MALGYLGLYTETLAFAVINTGAELLLEKSTEDHIKAAAVWALGQLGRHTTDHAARLAQENVLTVLVETYQAPGASEELRSKCKRALKVVVAKCTSVAALQPLVIEAPPEILKYVLEQLGKLLPRDVEGRRRLVQCGGLKRIQTLDAPVGSRMRDSIEAVNGLYPKDIVNYFSPNYTDTLLKKLDDFLQSSPPPPAPSAS
eukprot:Filipodium_phascolosomae@DN2200_c0_g1_i2.p1